HEEAQEPLARVLLVGGEPALDEEAARLVQQGVHPLGLQQAAVDGEDTVVTLGLVQADDETITQPSPRRSRRLRLLGSVSARNATQPSPRRSRRLRLLGSVSARNATHPSPRRSLRLLASVLARTWARPFPRA